MLTKNKNPKTKTNKWQKPPTKTYKPLHSQKNPAKTKKQKQTQKYSRASSRPVDFATKEQKESQGAKNWTVRMCGRTSN